MLLVFITHFGKILGILGHSIPLGDMWDNIPIANCAVIIKILQTPFFCEYNLFTLTPP